MQRVILSILLLSCLCHPALSFAQLPAQQVEHPAAVVITKLDVLNSSSKEANLSLTGDGNQLYFMSQRGGQTWTQKFAINESDSVHDSDIYLAKKVEGKWQKPEVLPYGINTGQEEDEPVISPDGKNLIFQSWDHLWDREKGPYYTINLSQKMLQKRIGLGGGITDFFQTISSTDGMTVSLDSGIFLVAAGEDYDKPMDIFRSFKTEDGWAYCERLPLSTKNNERTLFITADGKTLYFASDGYEGFGGLDIFKTTLQENGAHGEVINLGLPINSPEDDSGFILSQSGKDGFFIRNGDVFHVDLTQANPLIFPANE